MLNVSLQLTNAVALRRRRRWGMAIIGFPAHIYLYSLCLLFSFTAAFALQEAQTSITQQYDAARQALKKKDYQAAAVLARQVLAVNTLYQDSSGQSVWHLLGRALEHQEKNKEAIRILEVGRENLQTAGANDWALDYDLARLYAENQTAGKENEITELVYEVFKNSTPEKQPEFWQRLEDEIAFLPKEPERSKLKKEFSKSGGHPGLLLLRFLKREDPYPTTSANEALLTFFQRAAEARKQFGYALSPRGYDDRGEIYVRYGKPWRVHPDHSGTMGDVGWAIHPNEVWFYNSIHPDMYFTFIIKEGQIYYSLADGPESVLGSFYRGRSTFFNRPVPGGGQRRERATVGRNPQLNQSNAGETAMKLRDQVYRNLAPSHENFRRRLYEISNMLTAAEASSRSQRIDYTEALNYSLLHYVNEDIQHVAHVDSIAPAVVFDEYYKLKSLPVELSFSRFHDAGGKIRAEIYYGGLYRDLKFKRSREGQQARLRGEIAILDGEYNLVASDSIRENCLLPIAALTDSGNFVNQANFSLAPARYHLFFRLEDPEGECAGDLRYDLDVDAFSENSLSLSDIQLSSDIQETNEAHRFVKNGLRVTPLPGLKIAKGQRLFVYFEIYNLARNDLGETNYQIDYRVYAPESKKGFFKKLFGGDDKKHSVTLSASRQGNSPNPIEHVELDLKKLESNDLELEIVVTDAIVKKQVSTKLPFKLEES